MCHKFYDTKKKKKKKEMHITKLKQTFAEPRE